MTGSAMSRNSGCFLMKAATIGETRDYTSPVRAGRLERLAHQNGGQPASAESFVDLSVVEHPLVAAVGDRGKPDGFAVDGDGVLPVGDADGGLSAGLIGGHS